MRRRKFRSSSNRRGLIGAVALRQRIDTEVLRVLRQARTADEGGLAALVGWRGRLEIAAWTASRFKRRPYHPDELLPALERLRRSGSIEQDAMWVDGTYLSPRAVETAAQDDWGIEWLPGLDAVGELRRVQMYRIRGVE